MNGCPVQRVREGSGHRHRQAPRRPVHRLPVLHVHVPVRRAQVQHGARHRAQVRHVQRSPRARRGAGLRAGLPQRGHPHHASSQRDEVVAGDRGQRVPARRADARRHAADDGLQDRRARCPRNLLPGRLLLGQPRARAPAAGGDADADAARRSARSSSTWCSGACWARSRGRGLGFTNALFALALGAGRARGEHAAPRPAAVRVPRGARAAHLVAEPRDRRASRCSPAPALAYAGVVCALGRVACGRARWPRSRPAPASPACSAR